MENQISERPEYLRKLRENTCYTALRIYVGMGSLLFGMGFAGYLGVLVVPLLLTGRNYDDGGIKLLVGGLAFALGIFFSFAFHQASSLLIDIADILIDQNTSKEKPAIQEQATSTPINQTEIESRLSSLNILLTKGFISEEDYKIKKMEILSELKR